MVMFWPTIAGIVIVSARPYSDVRVSLRPSLLLVMPLIEVNGDKESGGVIQTPWIPVKVALVIAL